MGPARARYGIVTFLVPISRKKLAIENVIQEGNGAEGGKPEIEAFRRRGYEELAQLWEMLTVDESQHARIGNKWLLYLVDNSEEKYKKVVD